MKQETKKFFQDSFLSVFGNGIGNALLLISGILIARFLGKDLYGEYGVVKTNMFYMAGFSTFGMVYSSTRYIARYYNKDKTRLIGIIHNSTKISLTFSILVAVVLACFANNLETLLNTPGIASVFRSLAVIVVLKALASTGTGILAGLGNFKSIAISNVVSGFGMFLLCVPFTYFWGLYGSLFSLAFSQLLNCSINYWYIYKECQALPICYKKEDSVKRLLHFSFPVALQEISFAVCNWAGILILTKLSTLSEVGIYTATAQWKAVIMIIPGLLANVVLSHLSGSEGKQQETLVYKILGVYFICTLVPFLIVYMFSDVIVSFYGNDFLSMEQVLNISILTTIPACCSEVFKAELIAIGKTWLLFSLRMMKDLVMVVAVWCFLSHNGGVNGAYYYAFSVLVGAVAFFVGAFIVYKFNLRKHWN